MKGRKGDDRGVRRYREMGLCVTAHDCVRLRALLRECGEALEPFAAIAGATPEIKAHSEGEAEAARFLTWTLAATYERAAAALAKIKEELK